LLHAARKDPESRKGYDSIGSIHSVLTIFNYPDFAGTFNPDILGLPKITIS